VCWHFLPEKSDKNWHTFELDGRGILVWGAMTGIERMIDYVCRERMYVKRDGGRWCDGMTAISALRRHHV